MTRKIAKKGVGLSILGIAAGAILISSSAGAQPNFDKKIEKATADQVAKRLGDLRDGMEIDEPIILVPLHIFDREVPIDNFSTKSIQNSPQFVRGEAIRRYKDSAKSDVRIIHIGTVIEN